MSAATPSRCDGWMSIRNMSGAFSPICTEKSRSRFACSARTPRMKNAPRPTASRMTRVWLPGTGDVQHGLTERERARVSQRLHGADERSARQMQHEGDGHEAAGQHQTDRPAIPPARPRPPTSAAATAAVDSPLQPVESLRRRGCPAAAAATASRCALSSSGTTENSIDTSRPTASPWSDRGDRQPVLDRQQRGEIADEQRQRTAVTTRGNRDAQDAAGQAEQQHLRQVDAEHLPRRAARRT